MSTSTLTRRVSSGSGQSRPLPPRSLPVNDPPIAAWLHQGAASRGTVSVTFPGTYKAMSLTRTQVTRLRKALEAAEAIFARDEAPSSNLSIDLMKRVSE